MSSKDMGLISSHRIDDDNNNNSQLLFPDDSLPFNCGSSTHKRRLACDPCPKTRQLTGFIDDKMFGIDRGQMYFQSLHRRTIRHDRSDDSEEAADEEDDDTDELDQGDGDGEDDGLVNNNNNTSSDSVHSAGADKIAGDALSRRHSSFGSSMVLIMKDSNTTVQSASNTTRESPGENHQQVRATNYQNANAIAESDADIYYSQFVCASKGLGYGQKGLVMENGRKDVSFFCESGNSLKMILSDPVSGDLMDDAVILPCGHSFGGGGVQQVLKMRACYTCSQSTSEESVQPNLSLRAAVMAFRREEELRSHRSTKRRREKFEEKGTCGNSSFLDASRGRGVQFPFVVTDRVVIKGNKRTPERFVGREAVVTTQCLNGWYVVKTLDNAESVKLQYRSLAKVAENQSSKPMSNKITPNWL